MTSTCRCGRPTRDANYVCDDCATRLSQALGDIPWLAEELDTSSTRAKGVDYRTKGGTRSTEKPLPFNNAISDAREHLLKILIEWVKFCNQEHIRNQSPSQDTPALTLEATSRFLLWRVDGLTLVELGEEAVDEITAAVTRCHRLIDRPADRMYAGRCGSELDDATCERELYVAKGAKTLKCPNCGTVWDVADRREWLLREAEETLATAVEIARAVSWLGEAPLTSDRVRKWAQRKQITVLGHNREGKALYRVGDAIDLLSRGTKETVA